MSTISQAIEAAKKNDLEFIKNWIKEGNDPNTYDDEGWTPLLTACVRANNEIVDYLLNNEMKQSDPQLPHKISEGKSIHFAAHAGSIEVSDLLLQKDPSLLESEWLINGHTLLLQAAFYGHLELTKFVLEKGGNTAACTVRGLAPMEFAKQFQNVELQKIIEPYDSTKDEKESNFKSLMEKIKPVIPEDQKEEQAVADELFNVIDGGLKAVANDPSVTETTLEKIKDLIENKNADVKRLAGPLQQPALIVAVTGTNGDPINENIKNYRNKVSELLLDYGADPAQKEIHPMGVDAIIRAAVFNHLDILKMMGNHMTPEALKDALNEKPMVNGLTGFHDTVLRGSMVGADRVDGYLDQIRWFVDNGGDYNIEDFTGRTQLSIARSAKDPETRKKILEIFGIED